MRNCVLSILGSIVLKVLSRDDLEEKNRDLRDQCLDHLEDHLHDVHAFVRSKVRPGKEVPFFTFDYDSLPISFQSEIAFFPLVALDKI